MMLYSLQSNFISLFFLILITILESKKGGMLKPILQMKEAQ